MKQVRVEKGDIPEGWSTRAADFINKTIKHNPEKRLGFNYSHNGGQIDELMNHKWFSGFKWDKLRAKKLTPPFVPEICKTNFSKHNAVKNFKDEETPKLLKFIDKMKTSKYQKAFEKFNYDRKN